MIYHCYYYYNLRVSAKEDKGVTSGIYQCRSAQSGECLRSSRCPEELEQVSVVNSQHCCIAVHSIHLIHGYRYLHSCFLIFCCQPFLSLTVVSYYVSIVLHYCIANNGKFRDTDYEVSFAVLEFCEFCRILRF